TKAGFRALYSARRKLAPRADTQLAEQALNRDHHASDPCSQAKNRRRSPKSTGMLRLPHPPVLGHLTIPRNYLRTAPDSWGFKACQNTRRPSRCSSDRPDVNPPPAARPPRALAGGPAVTPSAGTPNAAN